MGDGVEIMACEDFHSFPVLSTPQRIDLLEWLQEVSQGATTHHDDNIEDIASHVFDFLYDGGVLVAARGPDPIPSVIEVEDVGNSDEGVD